MGNYSSAAGKGKTQQCFPKDEGRALNLRTGQLKPFLPQGELARETGLWPDGGTPVLPRTGSPSNAAEGELLNPDHASASCDTPSQRTAPLTALSRALQKAPRPFGASRSPVPPRPAPRGCKSQRQQTSAPTAGQNPPRPAQMALGPSAPS